MNTQTEEWRPIKGYENYMVSSLGQVKSLNYNKTGKEKILKQHKMSTRDYLQVTLCKEGKTKKFLVHRLVAEAFINNPNNLPQVNHKDFNQQNNSVENLEFCDCKYNNTYSFGKQIKCYDIITKKTIIYPSIREASRQFGIQVTCIWQSIYKYKSPYKNRYIFSKV